MSDAFAAMQAVLAADPNLGADAAWTSKDGGPAVAVRVVPTRPEAAFGLLDGPQMRAISTAVMLPASALGGRPQRGDSLVFGGVAYEVAEVLQDSRAASYTLGLRRA